MKIDQIKHYKIQEKIGAGGMGSVYRAFDPKLERDVAIKVLHQVVSEDDQNVKRLIFEARAAAKLVHPNVVTIYEVGKEECGSFIVMEYVSGLPLSKIIADSAPLAVERAINLISQILKALALSHKNNIIHRDIKPDNILVTENDEAKVLDFGIAKVAQASGLTMAGEVLGTVEFMAPEQMLGEDIDSRCDIYSVGIVLYQALTKELPFSGNNAVEILFNKLNEEPVLPSYFNNKINADLDQVILKALTHKKEDRWVSSEAMIHALESTINNQKLLNMNPWSEDDDIEISSDLISQTDSPKSIKSVFIGREEEYKQLIHTFHKINHEGQTLILSGEAGVGKSTLANQFRNYIDHQDSWLLYGTCLYQEGMDAYLPYIDALRGFFDKDNPKFSDNLRFDLKQMIKEKVPVLEEFIEQFSTTFLTTAWNIKEKNKDQSSNLFEGLHILFTILSEIKPVVLIIDDLQWADESSLRLFHYLSRNIINNKIFLFGISRTDFYDLQENGKPKLIVDMQARMRREGIVKEVELKCFTRDDCDILLDKSLDNTAFTESFYQGMFSETKGNPFFVIESLKLFCDKGEIYDDNGIWFDKKIDFKSKVPNRVEDIFVRRLSGLNEDDRELLQLASIIGYKFDPSLLSQVLGIKKIDLLKRLQKIERDFQIIVSLDRYFQFEHPMLADLLYNEIPLALTKEYHLMIADELQKIHGGNFGALVGNAALHFRNGGDQISAIPLLYKAAVRSFELSAFRESCTYFEDMLDSVRITTKPFPEDIPEIDLYFNLGICYEEIDNWDKSLEAYKMLAAISDKKNNQQKLADALMRIGRVYDKLGQWDNAVGYYEKSLAKAKEYDIKNIFSRVYNKIGVYHFHTGNFDQALTYFRKTIHSADSNYGEFDKAHAYTNIGIIANILRGNYGIALENFDRALEIYKKKENPQGQARVYHNIGMFYSDNKQWLEALQSYEKCLKLANDEESKHLKALTYLNMGNAYARQRKFIRAKKIIEKAFKIFKRMTDVISMAEAFHVYGLIYAGQKNYTKADHYLNNAIKMFKNKDYREGLAGTYETYGKLCFENGQMDKSVAMYEKSKNLYASLNMDAKLKTVEKQMESLFEEIAID